MKNLLNMYCDESCHTQNDGNKIMALGCVWCPSEKVRDINNRIREIKNEAGITSEMKWVKISEKKKSVYMSLIKYFFDCDALHFRGLIVDNKDALRHKDFNQTHDDWYFKMYFQMLVTILDPNDHYNIYLDIKDTKSKSKVDKLKDILSNNMYDFSQRSIKKVQMIRSHEVEIMQITDILLGALSYYSRGFTRVNSKREIISIIQEKSGYSLDKSTLYLEKKFNIFHLSLQESKHE